MNAPNSWAQARTSIPCFDDWFDFYGPFIKKKEEKPGSSKKNAGIVLLEGLIKTAAIVISYP